jgi:hypothetical protein
MSNVSALEALDAFSLTGEIPEWAQVLVTCEDESHLDAEFAWNGRHWLVRAGETKLVLYFAVIRSFGDPRSVDMNDGEPEHQYRTKEFMRVQQKWGIENPLTKDEEGPVRQWDRHVPRIRVEMPGTGEQLLTVVQDPKGAHVAGRKRVSFPEADDLDQTIARAEAQLAHLKSMAGHEDGEVDRASEFIDDDDLDDAPPVLSDPLERTPVITDDLGSEFNEMDDPDATQAI